MKRSAGDVTDYCFPIGIRNQIELTTIPTMAEGI